MSETAAVIANPEFEPRADLDRAQQRAWLAGGIGVVGIVIGFLTLEKEIFYSAYLVAWLLCLSVGLGMYALLLLGHLTGGDWHVALRRVFEASGRLLPYFLVAGVPLVFGLEYLYPWVDPEVGPDGHVDHLLEHKAPYLNLGFFLLRAVVYFAVWTVIAWILSAWSKRHDASGDPAWLERMKKLSAAAIVAHFLLTTFASVDWIMSVDPEWFSSLFGLAFLAAQGLGAFAFSILLLDFLGRRHPFSELTDKKLFHDYGKLMFAAILVWTYFMVSQYLIIWSGDLPEEVLWYLERGAHGWKELSALLVIGQFALPFALLLSADLKKRGHLLRWVALWVLLMRWLDFYWLIVPSVYHGGVPLSWLYPVAPLGIGGIWLALLLGQLKGRALVPVRDPALKEVLAHG